MTDATRFPLRSVWVSETSKLIRNMSKSFYKDFFYVKLFFSNPKYQPPPPLKKKELNQMI